MPVFSIHHITRYVYDRPVKESCNEVKIYPFNSHLQETISHNIHITCNPEVHIYTDYWGNKAGYFQIAQPHSETVIDSRLTVRTIPIDLAAINKTTTLHAIKAFTKTNVLLTECVLPDNVAQLHVIKQIINECFTPNMSVFEIAEKCNNYIFTYFTYTKGITNVETTVDEILTAKAGVCQDFAHVMLQVLRTIGIPCRYVSGYICPNKNGLRGEGATHAWVEVFIPQTGWVGIDPTNNIWVTDNHVKLAVGRHFMDCTPMKGVFKGPASQQLSVYVSVGYEDGHVFEELNKVNMEIIAEDGQKTITTHFQFDEQQQQQQQQ
ncbi:MAG: transglutaminase family protein [Chitinophagaceae bacterium]